MAVAYLVVSQIKVVVTVSNLVGVVVAMDLYRVDPFSQLETVSPHSVSFFQQDSIEKEVEGLLLIYLFGLIRFPLNFNLEP